MTVSRLRDIPGIGVDAVGDPADAAGDPEFLRLENLDTDLRPPEVALAATRAAVDDDAANSYLPFQGHRSLLAAATPMTGWGPSGEHYLRFVFANEPAERLAGLGERFRAAIG